MADFVQGVTVKVIVDGKEQIVNLSAANTELAGTVDKVKQAHDSGTSSASQLEQGMNRLEKRIIMVAAQWLLYKAVIESIKGADNLRDLETQMTALAGGTQGAADAMAYFESVQMRSRATVSELATTYLKMGGDVKAAMGAAFDPKTLVEWTVTVANASKMLRDVDVNQVQRFLDMAIRGKFQTRGPVAEQLAPYAPGGVLIDTGDKQKNLDNVVTAIANAGEASKALGQTFDTTMGHIRDVMTVAFAQGTANARKSYEELFNRVNSEDFKQVMRDLGTAAVMGVSALGRAFEAIVGGVQASWGIIKMAAADVIDLLASFESGLSKLLMSGANIAAAFGQDKTALALAQASVNSEMTSKSDKLLAGDIGLSGAASSLAGLKLLNAAFSDIEKAKADFSKPPPPPHLTVQADDAKAALRALKAEYADWLKAISENHTVDTLLNSIAKAFNTQTENPADKLFSGLEAQYTKFKTDLETLEAKFSQATDPAFAKAVGPAATEAALANLKLVQNALANLKGEELDKYAADQAKQWNDELEKSAVIIQRIEEAWGRAAFAATDAIKKFDPQNLTGLAGQTASLLQWVGAGAMSEGDTAKMQALKESDRAAWDRDMTEINAKWRQTFTEGAKALLDTATAMKAALTTPIEGIVTALTKGGTAVRDLLTGWFQGGIKAGAGDLAAALAKGLSGALNPQRSDFGPAGAAGDLAYQTQLNQNAADVQAFSQKAQIAAGAIVHLADVASGKIHESAAATIIGATAAGAAIGSWIGAIVGFVVGSITALAAPPIGKDYAYGTASFDPKTGQASFVGNANTSLQQNLDAQRGMQDTVEHFYNSYAAILLKFPAAVVKDIIPKFLDMFANGALNPIVAGQSLTNPTEIANMLALGWQWTPNKGGKAGNTGQTGGLPGEYNDPTSSGLGGGQIGGGTWTWVGAGNPPAGGGSPSGTTLKQDGGIADLGNQSSAHFWDNFTAWLKNTLPENVATFMKTSVGAAYEAMGMTTDGFGRLWDRLKGMDPQAALKVLSDMADGLNELDRVNKGMANLGAIPRDLTGFRPDSTAQRGNTNLLGKDGDPRQFANDFLQSVADSKDGFDQLALSVTTLVGPDQVTAFKNLTAAEGTMFDNLVTYLNQLATMSKALSQSIADAKFSAQLAAITDPQAKSDFLYQQYMADLDKLKNAKALGLNPDDVNRYTTDAQNMLTQMLALDPAQRLTWYLGQLDVLDTAQKQAFADLGSAAKTAVQQELDLIKPVTDWFKDFPDVSGQPFVDATASMTAADTAMASAATTAGTKLAGFSSAVSDATARLLALGTGVANAGTNQASTYSADGGQNVDVQISVSDPQGFVQSVRSRRTATR